MVPDCTPSFCLIEVHSAPSWAADNIPCIQDTDKTRCAHACAPVRRRCCRTVITFSVQFGHDRFCNLKAGAMTRRHEGHSGHLILCAALCDQEDSTSTDEDSKRCAKVQDIHTMMTCQTSPSIGCKHDVVTSTTFEVCVGALHLGQGWKAAPGVLYFPSFLSLLQLLQPLPTTLEHPLSALLDPGRVVYQHQAKGMADSQ